MKVQMVGLLSFYLVSCVEGVVLVMALVVMVVVVVVVVLVVVKVAVGVVVAIVVGMLHLLLVWLVVLVYHLPVPAVCSDSFDCGENDGSVVGGCCSGSWFSQNCGNLQMS